MKVSLTNEASGYHDNTDEQDDADRKRRGQPRLSLSLGEGSSGFNQPWSRYASHITSDESDSDKDDMWEELQELRDR